MTLQAHEQDQRDRAIRFQHVFGTEMGEKVLADIKAFCRWGRPKIGEDAGGRVDAGKSLVFCGMETVAVFIQDQLDVNTADDPLPDTAES